MWSKIMPNTQNIHNMITFFSKIDDNAMRHQFYEIHGIAICITDVIEEGIYFLKFSFHYFNGLTCMLFFNVIDFLVLKNRQVVPKLCHCLTFCCLSFLRHPCDLSLTLSFCPLSIVMC